MALSFWSSPRNDLNLVRVPMTSRLCPSTRIVLPIGSACAKNRSRTPLPMTATSRRCRSSASVKKRPSPSVALISRKWSAVTPTKSASCMSWPLYRAVTGGRPKSPISRKSSTETVVAEGDLLLDGHGVFVAERLAQPLLARQGVGSAHLQLVNPQRARAELLRHVHQLLVQAGDDRSHRDHRGGADQHAEHREERAEFVRAERVQRQQQILANVLTVGLQHSDFNSPISAPR